MTMTPKERHRALQALGIVTTTGFPGEAGGPATAEAGVELPRSLDHPAMVRYREHAGIDRATHERRLMFTTAVRGPEIRSGAAAGTVSVLRPSAGVGNTLAGHFTRYDMPAEINSAMEGRFIETIKRGAFANAFRDGGRDVRVMFQHGQDPSIGQKLLGAPTVLREDPEGAYQEAALIDASYVNDIAEGVRAGLYGMSFKFTVRTNGESWNYPNSATAANPNALPERTLVDLNLFEYSVVTWPAYPGTSAGIQ